MPPRRCPQVVALAAGVAVARAVAYLGGVVTARSGDADPSQVSLLLLAAVLDLVWRSAWCTGGTGPGCC